MLESRKLSAAYNGSVVKRKPTKGCPQGGVLSPLLRSLVVDELLTKLEKTGIQTYGFADDIALATRGRILVLRDLLQKGLRVVEKWGKDTKLSVNPKKTTAMVFTRNYKYQKPEPLKLNGEEIKYASTVKYLGVYIHLRWTSLLNMRQNALRTGYLAQGNGGRTDQDTPEARQDIQEVPNWKEL